MIQEDRLKMSRSPEASVLPLSTMLRSRLLALVVALYVVPLGAGCDDEDSPHPPQGPALHAQVLEILPHDATRFTQGLEISDGVLYESTGLKGESRLIATEFVNGRLGVNIREAVLPAPIFGEGLTVVQDRIWQLTWVSEFAIERDRETFAERRRVPFEGEGWGLCYDGEQLVMSDGSAKLTFRNPETFAPTGSIVVRSGAGPVYALNELECVDGAVWANVYETDYIVRIDPMDGSVTGVVDAQGLLSPEQYEHADVLNGIAAIPGAEEFLITGKRWPAMFRVRFEP